MEDDILQAVRNCRACKQDLPEVEFRSIKDPTKFTGQCMKCRESRKEGAAKSRAAVAMMRNIALRLSPRKAKKRTDSLADLTPPRRAAPAPSSVSSLPPPAAPALFRDLAPALPDPSRPELAPSNSGVVDKPFSSTPSLSLPTVVLGTPIPRSTHSTTPVVVLGTPIPEEPLPPTPSLPPQARRRGCYARQSSQPQERQFDQIVDPPFTGELNLPALSEEDQALVQQFYTSLNGDKMHSCLR
ncbi:ATP-dependent DNA helicase PIF1 [Metarhizium guizhouense ARSEF 977]|uniref:ATP-dependent DNA helicase PIF1 n=1 Tax=Metarhizium guizhouense (strain ARSEF 977) TaxID=1276136 RepID=A0A0B4GU43_METGA|nr:ATP-dependent DNA helicase PIF1 [Metarhizium guizhouense ARSEF 977]